MASKNHTSPQALTSSLTSLKQGERTREGSRLTTSQRIDLFPISTPQHTSTVSQLDYVSDILLKAISLVDEDLDGLKETNSGGLGEDKSQSCH